MAMATRHRCTPVLIGATIAFLLLNLLAVPLGASLAQWLPTPFITVIAITMFALFGLHALFSQYEYEEESIGNSSKVYLLLLLR